MPFYYRRPYNYYRRRWHRRRRPRGPFRRRRYRNWRRRRWVRKKLSKINLKQYQPPRIIKSTVKGLQPLFIANKLRLGNNFRQYEHSLIPEFQPGGGGFSITRYSLEALYEQFRLDRNWWTKGNENLPLVRYLKCTLKFYRSATVDYVVHIYNCYPMLATALMYMSCQPSIMMMNHKSILIPSKQTQPKGKHYKKITVRPPGQLLNKWYFTKDLSPIGLVLLTCSAASFDNYYISTNWESNNISFKVLNPHFWQLHNFQQPGVQGYAPFASGTIQKHMWTTHSLITEATLSTHKWGELIYLGNSTLNAEGIEIKNWTPGTNLHTEILNHRNWGNPFRSEYLTGAATILTTTKNPVDLLNGKTKDTMLNSTDIQFPTQELLHTCRYTPDRDTGENTKVYLLSTVRDTTNWDPPHKIELIQEGFPLWLILFGFLDWQRKLGEATNLNRDYILVIQSPFINPSLPYYILIDDDFLNGYSPYTPPDHRPNITDTDNTKWYPQVYYQHQTVEKIIQTGPGIARLGQRTSVEAKLKYAFHFKFGGCPSKAEKITDPSKENIYPVPNSEQQLYSLQDPNTPPENFLYNFDIKRDIITKPAAKRIKTDWSTEKTLFTDGSRMDPEAAATQTTETSPETSEDSEKEEETLLLKLRQQRRKRKQLQQRILQLMQQQ